MYRFDKQPTKHKLISIGQAAELIGVSIDTLRRWDKAGQLPSIRSGSRGHRFYNLSDIEQLTQDQYNIARDWVELPQGIEPEAEVYCKTRDVFQVRLEKFQLKLSQELPLSTVSLVTAIAGEIGNNSFDHNLGNWPDITGIFFSYSMRSKSVVLADRGQGILTTLKRVKPELLNAQKALRAAFTQTISGRFPEARGNGLKFVRQVVINNPFTLRFQTEDAYLNLKQYDKDVIVKRANSFIRGCFAKIGF